MRGGLSQALVVRGEAGVGKTALLGHLLGHASVCRVEWAVGVESEMELAFAGLHQLCAPMLDRLDRLPHPQREALATAFGLGAGDPPDPFLVGLAVLGLMSETARERPLICVVDDSQWLDHASLGILAFVARRLAAEAVAMVFAERLAGGGEGEPILSDLPALVLDGLAEPDARALLDSVVAGPLDDRVRDRFLAETRGNPLALVELLRGLTPEQLAGGFGIERAGGLAGRIEESFGRRVESLPPATRRLLLVAAAEPGQDPVVIWRAAARLGVTVADALPAARTGLVDFAESMRFCHPLARSTVYRMAAPDERRSVHRALANAIDADSDADRRAWHRAAATSGLDEDVAAELEQSAARAQARGGISAAAAFRERAAELTPDPARRAERALSAAQAKYQAGAPDRALRLLVIAESGPRDELASAHAQLLRAQIASGSGPGRDAPLLAAAKRLEPLDLGLARETYRDAFYAALTGGRLARSGRMLDVATAVRACPAPALPLRPEDRLLDGLAVTITEGYSAGAPLLKDALKELRDTTTSREDALRWLPLACRMSHDVYDDETWRELSARTVKLARDRGGLWVLPVALLLGLPYHLFAGDLSLATTLAEESAAVAEATGAPLPPYGALVIAAWRGLHHQVAALVGSGSMEPSERGEGQWVTTVAWATALLSNGHGLYADALTAAEQGSAYPDELGLANWSMIELVEAAARAGRPERARRAMGRLSEIAGSCGTDWALGIEARSRALLSEGTTAESSYREAIERLGSTRVRTELARAQLVYGEWLRRENRRVDARHQLRAAHELFSSAGAEAFAERARRELAATGETARKRTVETVTELTEQEVQIARLAVEGRTNPEIGSQLFISPRTVEWHLRKVYAKLGIRSRRELRSAVSNAGRWGLPSTSPR